MVESAAQVQCPYCGEWIELSVDASAGAQRYVEDCQVCCRPMEVSVEPGETAGDGVRVRVWRDDE
jgi:hypothetical protein